MRAKRYAFPTLIGFSFFGRENQVPPEAKIVKNRKNKQWQGILGHMLKKLLGKTLYKLIRVFLFLS